MGIFLVKSSLHPWPLSPRSFMWTTRLKLRACAKRSKATMRLKHPLETDRFPCRRLPRRLGHIISRSANYKTSRGFRERDNQPRSSRAGFMETIPVPSFHSLHVIVRKRRLTVRGPLVRSHGNWKPSSSSHFFCLS